MAPTTTSDDDDDCAILSISRDGLVENGGSERARWIFLYPVVVVERIKILTVHSEWR